MIDDYIHYYYKNNIILSALKSFSFTYTYLGWPWSAMYLLTVWYFSLPAGVFGTHRLCAGNIRSLGRMTNWFGSKVWWRGWRRYQFTFRRWMFHRVFLWGIFLPLWLLFFMLRINKYILCYKISIKATISIPIYSQERDSTTKHGNLILPLCHLEVISSISTKTQAEKINNYVLL